MVDAVIESVTFVPDSTQLTLATLGPTCLTKGTLVETKSGQVAVEDLQVSDLIRTTDNGFQPLRWVGSRTVDGTSEFAPICLSKSSFGNTRDLLVSPEHRMLVSGWKCELLFAQEEVLCAAKHLLCNSDTIYRKPCAEVTYFHLMFDQHEIIFAEGAATESFFMGAEVAKSDRETFLELVSLFPERADPTELDSVLPARMMLKRFEAESLQTL